MSTAQQHRPAADRPEPSDRTAPTSRMLVPLAWASLVTNILIVVTGGAVRLTGSGLGCPTWPRCSEGSYVPHGSLGVHGAIEFGNRMLTFALTAVVLAALVVAWRTGRRHLRRLAGVVVLGIPAQALLGGLTVLTDLNPWLVAGHLLVSMAIIGIAVAYVRACHAPDLTPARDPAHRLAPLGWSVLACGWAVLYLGTVVTGAGPHAGDLDSPRNGLDPAMVSQLHADVVFLLVGLTGALVLALRVLDVTGEARHAAFALLGVELAQGLVGFVQYATDLPVALVAVHVLGAALTAAALTWTALALGRPLPAARPA